MSRILAALFLCLAFAPAAHAQSIDCASASGFTQRLCAAPELVALEEERRALVSEIQFSDPAHPAIQDEAAFLASQEACADATCIAAGYSAHNQILRDAIAAAPAPEPEPTTEAEAPPAPAPSADDGRGVRLDEGATIEIGDYLTTIITLLVTFFIAFWLWGIAARARRADRGER